MNSIAASTRESTGSPTLLAYTNVPGFKSTSDKNVVALLGNGFSRSYDDAAFSYSSLLGSADFGELDAPIKSLFKRLESADFEYAIRTLNAAESVVQAMQSPLIPPNPTLDQLGAARNTIRDALAKAVLTNHPLIATEVDSTRALICAHFLARFSAVFTTNYDLLLYWVQMRAKENEAMGGQRIPMRDGFGWIADAGPDSSGAVDVLWPSSNTNFQNVFYLHGALHLFPHRSGMVKARSRTNAVIRDDIERRINDGQLPTVVIGGTADEKLVTILRSPYLCHCYQRLMALKSDHKIVSFGSSFHQNDRHLRTAIASSNVGSIWIGCRGPIGSPVDSAAREAADEMVSMRSALRTSRHGVTGVSSSQKPELNVHFYSTDSLNPWRAPSRPSTASMSR